MIDDKESKYGFDLSRLEEGDILLSFADTKSAKAIARVTNGPFSHAMLYVGDSLIHAMPDGVYSKNPQRLTFSDAGHLRALRVRAELSRTAKEALFMSARSWVGALYSKPEAGATRLFAKTKVAAFSSDKQFCSRLVAQTYASIGLDLVNNPDYCSPNDLLRSDAVSVVADGVRELTPQEIEFTKTKDFNLEVQRATFAWVQKVRELAARRGLGIVARQSDVDQLVLKHPGYDKVITGYVASSGYANYYAVDRSINPHRYSTKAFLALCATNKLDVMQALSEEQRLIDRDVKRRVRNSANAEANYEATHLQYFALELKLARNMLNELECRQQTLDGVGIALGMVHR